MEETFKNIFKNMLSYKVQFIQYRIAYQVDLDEPFQKVWYKSMSGVEGEKWFSTETIFYYYSENINFFFSNPENIFLWKEIDHNPLTVR